MQIKIQNFHPLGNIFHVFFYLAKFLFPFVAAYDNL